MSVARAAADRFDLERVIFIPSSRPPHRREGTFASYEDRFRMVSLACAEDSRFEASRLEAGPGVSYSIDTVERLKARPLYFLIGADAFADLRSWHRWEDLVKAVSFIVVSRPGARYDIPPGAHVERLEDVSLAISSSEIRQELAAGSASPNVPPAVAQYIRDHKLYGDTRR